MSDTICIPVNEILSDEEMPNRIHIIFLQNRSKIVNSQYCKHLYMCTYYMDKLLLYTHDVHIIYTVGPFCHIQYVYMYTVNYNVYTCTYTHMWLHRPIWCHFCYLEPQPWWCYILHIAIISIIIAIVFLQKY